MATSYSTGTVSIGAGSTTLTGVGTAWLTAGGIRAGDEFNAAGMSVRIASVNSNTSITLARPWPGGALSGANYDIWLKFDDDRALATAIALLASLDGGALEALSGLAGGANQLAFFTGVGTMGQTGLTAEARTLLASTLLSRSGNNLVTPAAARLTGGAVTQSVSDATAGRLLKFGDFGIGHAITLTAAMNLNDIAVSGHYFNPTAGNTTGNNYPVSVAGSLHHITDGSTARATQTFIAYGTAAIYVRSKGADGAWSAWKRIDSEYGVQNSGEYWRFGNGLQICTRTADLGSILANGSGTLANPYHTNPATLSFAAGFSAAPALTFAFPTAQGIGVPDRVLVPAGYDVGVGSITSLGVARIGGTATAANVICTITAIGRWF